MQQTDKILLAISGTEESIIEIDGYEVPVKLEAEDITFNELIQVPITIMGSRTVTATQNLYVGNIRVTTIYSQVSTGTRATSIITSDHWHRNINPAIIWSKQTSSNQTYMGNNNSRAYHRGDWIIYATGGLGFINETVKFWVSGDAVYRSKQFYSTHPNFNNYSWTPF
mgnify:CR=1 FL=1